MKDHSLFTRKLFWSAIETLYIFIELKEALSLSFFIFSSVECEMYLCNTVRDVQ